MVGDMTLPANSRKIGDRLPSADEKVAANTLRRVIASSSDHNSVLKLLDEEKQVTEVTLTPALSKLLLDLLRYIGNGDAVTLVPVGQKLTTQQAADILNVSRPYLIGLLKKQEIPFELVGRHRRIKAEDLFEYKKVRDEKRSDALSDLAKLDAELL